MPGGEEKLAERKGEASLVSSGKRKLSFEKEPDCLVSWTPMFLPEV